MKIAVIGKTGQLARELQKHPGVTTYGRDNIDLAYPDSCRKLIRSLDADIIINAAAYTAVDKAEDDPAAFVINSKALAAIASEAAERKIPLIHVSTDYVFNGTGTAPWQTDDRPDPVNAYGV